MQKTYFINYVIPLWHFSLPPILSHVALTRQCFHATDWFLFPLQYLCFQNWSSHSWQHAPLCTWNINWCIIHNRYLSWISFGDKKIKSKYIKLAHFLLTFLFCVNEWDTLHALQYTSAEHLHIWYSPIKMIVFLYEMYIYIPMIVKL